MNPNNSSIMQDDTEFKYPTKAEKNKKKEELAVLKRRIIYVEILFILFLTATCLKELFTGMDMFSIYSRISTTYYYENILFYIRNVNFIFDVTVNTNSTCGSSYSKENFRKVNYLENVCLIQNSQNSSYWDFYYTKPSDKQCTSTTFTLDQSTTINYWGNFYYCTISASQKLVTFYFVENNGNCETGDYKCGSYYNYTYCMRKDSTTNALQNITYCPLMNILPYTMLDIVKSLGMPYEVIHINNQNFLFTRIISEELSAFFFAFRLHYGNLSIATDNATFSTPYINYYRNDYLDFANQNQYSVLNHQSDVDVTKGFLNNYFNPYVVIDNSKTNYGILTIQDSPAHDFSILFKQNLLPEENCLSYFTYNYMKTYDFLSSLDLFINFVDLSGPRYIGWTIIELIYIALFYFYYKGFLIYYEFKGNIRTLDKNNECVSELTMGLLTAVILLIKCFNNAFQTSNLNINLNVAHLIIKNNCFKKDEYFNASLKLYYDDVNGLYQSSLSTIHFLIVRFAVLILYELIIGYYYYNKKKYDAIKKLFKTGLAIKNEKYRNRRKQNQSISIHFKNN